MTRQNRVDPLGDLHAVPARGAWMGNRGCLHDDQGRIVRAHQVRRWIICVTAFKDRPARTLMKPGNYTELFFLDEATAYAAGHRPCAECRREAYRALLDLWRAHLGPMKGAEDLDRALHAVRLDGAGRRLFPLAVDQVPPGAMIVAEGAPVLRAGGGWWAWSHHGYAPAPEPVGPAQVITPEPIVTLMRHGLSVQHAAPV